MIPLSSSVAFRPGGPGRIPPECLGAGLLATTGDPDPATTEEGAWRENGGGTAGEDAEDGCGGDYGLT